MSNLIRCSIGFEKRPLRRENRVCRVSFKLRDRSHSAVKEPGFRIRTGGTLPAELGRPSLLLNRYVRSSLCLVSSRRSGCFYSRTHIARSAVWWLWTYRAECLDKGLLSFAARRISDDKVQGIHFADVAADSSVSCRRVPLVDVGDDNDDDEQPS